MLHIQLVCLGENIRAKRRLLNISQEELAERCNLHRTYICDVERGGRNVSFLTLLRISEGLGATVGQLIENVESAKAKKESQVIQLKATIGCHPGRQSVTARPLSARVG